MGRKYYKYKRSYRHGNLLTLTRNEREALNILTGIIKLIIKIIVEICKGIYQISTHLCKLIRNFHKAYNNGYDLTKLLDRFDKLTPRQFEILMSELFRCQGYDDVRLTQYCHDYGRDIILTRRVNGYKEVTYVECKYFSHNNVIGRDICFKLLGSMQMFQADKGIVCSTGKFHKNSIEVANSVNNLKLMNSDEIKMMIFRLNAEQIQRVMFKLDNAS